ncbi:MAG: flagellar export protein FliJ [Pseudomonadota bacterium]
MSKDSFSRIAKIARSSEVKAAAEYRRYSDTLASTEMQLAQLNEFKTEYQARLEALIASGADTRQLLQYQRFLDGISSAHRQQGDVVRQAGDNARRSQEKLRRSSARRASLDALVDRAQSQDARQLATREQRLSDESYSHYSGDDQ